MNSGNKRNFDRPFIWGVMGFLALTAGLKLASVLGEGRYWSSPDPLFRVLTVRQTTFAAAVLEGAVVAGLLRSQDRRGKLRVILWLASVFGAYRLALFGIGFHGSCPCFGRLAWWVPASRPWVEWIAPLALCLMGAGSTVLLWMGRPHFQPDGAGEWQDGLTASSDTQKALAELPAPGNEPEP